LSQQARGIVLNFATDFDLRSLGCVCHSRSESLLGEDACGQLTLHAAGGHVLNGFSVLPLVQTIVSCT
jgi:hypothetical protein